MHSLDSDRAFIPAAGRHWRLPFYDLLARLLGAESARYALVAQVAPGPGDRMLDLGAGTGALAIALKRHQPRADVVGLDPDANALRIASRKAARAGLSIRFEQGFADELPYADASFDRVASSFVLHHLPHREKESALREMRRVLRPGGRVHLLDFDGAAHGGYLARRILGSSRLADTAEPEVLRLVAAAGFANGRIVARRSNHLAALCYYDAVA
jgi:ubiquinone/menaquinone biosynthesis C-methylase UbiE